MFGSKMAIAIPRDGLPQDLIPQNTQHRPLFLRAHLGLQSAGHRSRGKCFQPRLINRFICKPSDYLPGPVISNRSYIATIYRTQFSSDLFNGLFLEVNRLTLTWVGVLDYIFSDDLTMPSRSCGMARFIFRLFPLYRWRSTRALCTRIDISSRGCGDVVNFLAG